MATTVLDAILAIARKLGDLETTVATSGTANTVVAPIAADATTNASTTRYNARFLYRAVSASGDQQRIVRPQGFNPATATFTFDPAVITASVLGDTIYLTSRFPVDASGARDNTSYIDIVNMALRDLWAPDQILLTTVAGQYGYSLAAQRVWLDRPEQIVTLLDPPIVTGYRPLDAHWRLDRDSDGRVRIDVDDGTPTLWLRTAYDDTGQTAMLSVKRPANTLIGSLEGNAVALVSQVVLSELHELAEVGALHAYRTLYARTKAPEWAKLADAQEKAVLSDQRIRYLPRGDGRQGQPQTEAA